MDWQEYVASKGYGVTAVQDRNYFNAVYFQEHGEILFEIATDGPGFMGDEPYETLGEKLSLPPFFESKREEIEKLVRPIDTVRSTKEFVKEYED